MLKRHQCSLVVTALCAGLSAAAPVVAQPYPSQTVKIIVPTAPGGPNDIVARLTADMLAKLGQPAIVENRAGAGGALAAREVAKARPDGYTLLVGNTTTLAVNPAVSRSAGYDPVKSFAPVAKFWEAYQVLAVHSASPWRTLKEILDYVSANPSKLNYAHAGIGSFQHLIGELLMQRTSTKIIGVPFRGSADAVGAVLGQVVHMTFADNSIISPQVKAGNFRALAMTSTKRSPLVPELPTMVEAGVPDFEASSFFGIVAPAGTPDAVVRLLNATINEGLKTPKVEATIALLGVVSTPASPEEFAAFIAAKGLQWREVARAAGVTIN